MLLAAVTSCFQRAGGLVKKPLPAYWTASISHKTLFLLHSVEMNQTPTDPIYFIQNRVCDDGKVLARPVGFIESRRIHESLQDVRQSPTHPVSHGDWAGAPPLRRAAGGLAVRQPLIQGHILATGS